MWVGIAIVIAVVVVVGLAVAVWAWRRTPRVADDMRQWQGGMDALGRTAKRAPVGGLPSAAAEPDPPVDTVHVLGSREHGR